MSLQHEISKTFTFDAAHRLYLMPEEHPCRNLHGHTYTATLILQAKATNKNEYGMVLDYRNFTFFKELIDSFDHATLIAEKDIELIKAIEQLGGKYKILPIEHTTCECMLEFIMQQVKDYLFFADLHHIGVILELSETPKTKARVSYNPCRCTIPKI